MTQRFLFLLLSNFFSLSQRRCSNPPPLVAFAPWKRYCKSGWASYMDTDCEGEDVMYSEKSCVMSNMNMRMEGVNGLSCVSWFQSGIWSANKPFQSNCRGEKYSRKFFPWVSTEEISKCPQFGHEDDRLYLTQVQKASHVYIYESVFQKCRFVLKVCSVVGGEYWLTLLRVSLSCRHLWCFVKVFSPLRWRMSHPGVKTEKTAARRQNTNGGKTAFSSLYGVLLAPVAVWGRFLFFIWREHIPRLSSPV